MDKKILLGNEAIVQGALESGVEFVSTYPGTPASEIGNIFSKIAKDSGIYFEFSSNEKVALEATIGASFFGLRCLMAMKNFGVNVALDSLLPFIYTGSKGPVVIVVGDDPSCWSSGQSEQNSRVFSYLGHIPMLEPADAQECKDFTKLAFEISEKFGLPVILKETTRVAHQRMTVTINSEYRNIEISKYRKNNIAGFIKNPEQFAVMSNRVLDMKEALLKKIKEIRKFSEKSPINFIKKGKGNFGIITSGVSYLHALESAAELEMDMPILKLGFFYPLPEKKIADFLKGLKKVLIAEELDPYLEKEIRALAKEVNPKIQIFGKNILSEIGELNVEKISSAIAKISGKKFKTRKSLELNIKIPVRLPRLCPGCPYWLVFSAIKKVFPTDTIFTGDIGCSMIAGLPPHNLQDTLLCMGASIGVGHGIQKASSSKVVAFIGDSAFFHSGISSLVNCVYNKSNILIIVMDNRITAMTGHQPNPGMGKTGMGEIVEEIKIEDIAKSCGAKNVKTIDQGNIQEFEGTLRDFSQKEGVSLIIAKRICALLEKKMKN
jgi:indolepyruvate ferredoxin oxidoreductase, alpha subunit